MDNINYLRQNYIAKFSVGRTHVVNEKLIPNKPKLVAPSTIYTRSSKVSKKYERTTTNDLTAKYSEVSSKPVNKKLIPNKPKIKDVPLAKVWNRRDAIRRFNRHNDISMEPVERVVDSVKDLPTQLAKWLVNSAKTKDQEAAYILKLEELNDLRNKVGPLSDDDIKKLNEIRDELAIIMNSMDQTGRGFKAFVKSAEAIGTTNSKAEGSKRLREYLIKNSIVPDSAYGALLVKHNIFPSSNPKVNPKPKEKIKYITRDAPLTLDQQVRGEARKIYDDLRERFKDKKIITDYLADVDVKNQFINSYVSNVNTRKYEEYSEIQKAKYTLLNMLFDQRIMKTGEYNNIDIVSSNKSANNTHKYIATSNLPISPIFETLLAIRKNAVGKPKKKIKDLSVEYFQRYLRGSEENKEEESEEEESE